MCEGNTPVSDDLVIGSFTVDSGFAQTASSVRRFLTSQGITLMSHPFYSLDLDLRDLSLLFSGMKEVMKGVRFESGKNNHVEVTGGRHIMEEELQKGFTRWRKKIGQM